MPALIIAWRRTCSYGPIWASQPSSSTVSLHPLTDCVEKCSSAPHVLPTGHLQRMCAGYCTKGIELTAATPARPAERIHKLIHTKRLRGQAPACGTHPLETGRLTAGRAIGFPGPPHICCEYYLLGGRGLMSAPTDTLCRQERMLGLDGLVGLLWKVINMRIGKFRYTVVAIMNTFDSLTENNLMNLQNRIVEPFPHKT